MKHSNYLRVAFLSFTALALVSAAQAHASPQALMPSPAPLLAQPQPADSTTGSATDSLADANNDTGYANGTRAIQEGRWAEAESIFDKVAQGHGEHAQGALYWKAYAENKQGNSAQALKSCAELRQGYPNSRWIDDCGALEIEIHGKSGQPIEPQAEKDQDLKQLAINQLLQRDPGRALPQIEQILAGNKPESIKEQELFALAQNSSKGAQKLLAEVAHADANAPASIRSNTALQTRAQQLLAAVHGTAPASGASGAKHLIGVDVVVTNAQGQPVTGLTPQDFTLLDNGQQKKILGFHESASSANGENGDRTEMIILIDTVNSSLVDVGYARDQIDQFLRQDEGKLKVPVSILMFNGNGAQNVAAASRDGNALAAALDKEASNLHPIRRSEAYWGAVERLQLSLGTLGSLTMDEAAKPGRKLLVWISPGWPILAGEDGWTTSREVKTLFDEIVALSSGLRQARISICSVEPVRDTGAGQLRRFFYQSYRKPVTRVDNAKTGNLSLQILAEQSGGEVRSSTSLYLSQELAGCAAEADGDYFLTFDTVPADHLDEFHALKITANKPGLSVLTRNGYYNQP